MTPLERSEPYRSSQSVQLFRDAAGIPSIHRQNRLTLLELFRRISHPDHVAAESEEWEYGDDALRLAQFQVGLMRAPPKHTLKTREDESATSHEKHRSHMSKKVAARLGRGSH